MSKSNTFDFARLDISTLEKGIDAGPSAHVSRKNPPLTAVQKIMWALAIVYASATIIPLIWVMLDPTTLVWVKEWTTLMVWVAMILALVRIAMLFFMPLQFDNNGIDPVKKFARANDLFLATNKALPDEFEGVIFQKGDCKHQLFIADRQHDPLFFIADYTFLQHDKTYGDEYKVMSLKLPEVMTPIVIDARANNPARLTNLPVGYEIGPKLGLEGNFHTYFTLYCAEGEEQNVLKIMTPDVMAMLIDNFKDWDCEIWKDRLYFYRTGEFSYEGTELPEMFRLLAIAQHEFVRR